MTKRLVIIGAGGFGRTVRNHVISSPRFLIAEGISSIVYVDDAREPAVPVDSPIVSSLEDYWPHQDDLLLCSIGAPQVRREVVGLMNRRGGKFTSFIHDSVTPYDHVTVGVGAVICPGTIITNHVTIGQHVHINLMCSVGHDDVVGDFVTLSPNCHLMGNVTVNEGSFLGVSASVIPGTTIGSNVVVGAGSVIIKDIEDDATVVGNPAKPLVRKQM